MSSEVPKRKKETEQAQSPAEDRGGAGTAENEKKPEACKDIWKDGFRFDDPYWDDAFDSYHSPMLRVCCLRYC